MKEISYNTLLEMKKTIEDNEGIYPLSYNQVLENDGATVFLIGSATGYAKISVEKAAFIMEDSSPEVDMFFYGIQYFAYLVRPYSLDVK
jgi:pyrrolidone-carboxylate peptidase